MRLDVFDGNGRRIKTLVHAMQAARDYAVSWDGTDDEGRALPSGTYFSNLSVGMRQESRKVVILR